MTTPGVSVRSGEDLSSSTPTVDIGTWFVAILAEKGPIDIAVELKSMAQVRTIFGGRNGYNALSYDALQTFFEEGGSRAFGARVPGPSPVFATVTAKNGSSEDTLKITAASVGDWANDVDVVIVGASTTRVYEVKYGGVVVETSPAFTTNADAVSWAANSSYVRFEDKGKGLPVAATKELASGTDDHASATEATWLAALNLFGKDLGAGQVSMPGRTTEEAAQNVLATCEATNRVALLDGTDTGTPGTLVTQAAALRSESTARFGGLFAPWAVIPGLTGGTTRTVAPSAVVAGIMARNDNAGLNPNEPAAGGNGIARYATGLSQEAWSDDERGELNDAGVNVIRVIDSRPRVYGYRTLVDPTGADSAWLALSNARLDAFIKASAAAVGERFVMRQIGRRLPAEFGTAIEGEVLMPLFNDEALFGDTFGDAALVDVGDAVNTDETIEEGKLRAICKVVMSEFAETVEIEITKETI